MQALDHKVYLPQDYHPCYLFIHLFIHLLSKYLLRNNSVQGTVLGIVKKKKERDDNSRSCGDCILIKRQTMKFFLSKINGNKRKNKESDGPWKWVYNIIYDKKGFTFERKPVMK